MPVAQIIWQVRRCGTPFTVAQHSMQIPMPQSGPRGSPLSEKRHGSLAMMTAAATLAPELTRTCLPLTVMEQLSLIGCTLLRSQQDHLEAWGVAGSMQDLFYYCLQSAQPARVFIAVILLALLQTFTCREAPAWTKIEWDEFSNKTGMYEIDNHAN